MKCEGKKIDWRGRESANKGKRRETVAEKKDRAGLSSKRPRKNQNKENKR